MFKSQKIIVFSILLAIVGIGATVAIGIGISVRDSVNPDKSSAAVSDIVSDISGRLTCKTPAGTTYTKKNIVASINASFYSIDETNPVISQDWNPYQFTTSTINKDGTFKVSGSAPKDQNYFSISIKDSNRGVATNCSDFSKLIDNNGNGVCLNKEVTKEITNSCWGEFTYMCKRNLDTSTFNGFDFALTKCPEPVIDLKTKGIGFSSTISKNVGETLTMYFNGEDLSDYNTLNINYYFGAQGLRDIYSSYKVYFCSSPSDTVCSNEVILPTNPPEVSVSPWNIIAIGKNKTIKIEGKLLTTAKDNIPVKVQYAQLPSSILPVLVDSNASNNVWNGSVSITSTTPVVTPPVVNPPVVTSSTGTRTTTSSSRRSTSSTGSVVSESSSTETTVSTDTSSSEESSISSLESTSSKSSSSIKPYVPVTQTPSSDNNTLFLALVSLLVLFLVSIFVVYRKYKSEKESKEVFNRSPLEETPPTPTAPPSVPTV